MSETWNSLCTASRWCALAQCRRVGSQRLGFEREAGFCVLDEVADLLLREVREGLCVFAQLVGGACEGQCDAASELFLESMGSTR